MPYLLSYVLKDNDTYGCFLGWSATPGSSIAEWKIGPNGTPVTKSMTLYAVWDNTVQIVFNSMGGSDIPAQNVPVGGYVVPPEDPTRGNEQFSYWFTFDKNGQPQIWEFEEMVVTKPMTLFAYYEGDAQPKGGTKEVTWIGDSSIDPSEYPRDTVIDSELSNYFEYSIETLTMGNQSIRRAIITGLKNNPVNLVVPDHLYVHVSDVIDDLGNLQEVFDYVDVVEISNGAFSGCSTLKSVRFDFDRDFDEYTSSMFMNCTNLEFVDLSGIGLKDGSIGYKAFYNCTLLKAVKLPAGFLSIGDSAFAQCTSLQKVSLGEGVKRIQDDAFRDCSGLKELYLPDSLEELYYSYLDTSGAFYGCTGLEKISIGGLDEIKSGMFRTKSTVLKELEIRGTVRKVGASAFDSNDFSYSYMYSQGYYHIGDEVVGTTNMYRGSGQTALIVREGVEEIGPAAFRYCTTLGSVQLPDSLTVIGSDSFNCCGNLTGNLHLSNNLRTLGANAFKGCENLTGTVNISGKVETIGSSAFNGCAKLTGVIFGEGIKRIQDDAFRDCSGLKELYLPDSLEELYYSYLDTSGAFYGCTGLEKISIGGLDEIKSGMFRTKSTVLKELEIRGTVRKVGASAFDSNDFSYSYMYSQGYYHIGDEVVGTTNMYRGSGQTALIIREGVEEIGYAAFRYCTTLRSVQLPDSLTVIGSDSFNCCSNIRAFSFGSGVESINNRAFDGCSSMSVYVPSSATYVQAYLNAQNISFFDNGLPCLVLRLNANGGSFGNSGEVTENINSLADLPTLETPTYDEHIFSGWYLDAECSTAWDGVTLPFEDEMTLYAGWDLDIYTLTLHENGGILMTERVLRIHAGSVVVLPDPIRTDYGFLGWFTDSKMNHPFDGIMPDSDTSLFASWENVSQNAHFTYANNEATLVEYKLIETDSSIVSLPNSVNGMPLTTIKAKAFAGQNVTVLILPSTVVNIDDEAFSGMYDLRTIIVSDDNPAYCTVDGALLTRDGKTLVAWPKARTGVCNVPEGVITIRSHAFEQAVITEITLPEGLHIIGDYAFAGAAIEEIMLPESVETIGARAFMDCTELGMVCAAGEISTIGERAFSGCSAVLGFFGPISRGALEYYTRQNGLLYNYYVLTLHYAGREQKRLAQAGSALNLPDTCDMGENRCFIGWFSDSDCVFLFTDTIMTQGALDLYAGSTQLFVYESITDENGVSGLRLTECNAESSNVIVPETIDGMPVMVIATGCFGADYDLIEIGDSVITIEEGAFAADTVTLIAPVDSVGASYAHDNGLTFHTPEKTITFDVNGGAYLPAISLPAGTHTILPVPVRTAFDFEGWFIDEDLTNQVATEFEIPDTDITLHAGWTLVDASLAELTFTYVEDDGSIRITGSVDGATQIVIPETLHGLPVTAMESSAFAYNDAVTFVQIPGTINEVPSRAFEFCGSLEEVVLEEGVLKLEQNAFYGCQELTTITLPNSLQEIAAGSLASTALTTLSLGSGLTYLSSSALISCDALSEIHVAADNTYYFSEDGVLYDSSNDSLVRYPASRAGGAYSVRAGTVSIEAYAFEGASSLSEVTLPDTLVALGKGTFEHCTSLMSLPNLIGTLVNSIPADAFRNCTALEAIVLPTNITTIGSGAFIGCYKLTEIEVPSEVMTIGAMAFPSETMLYSSEGSVAENYAKIWGNLFVNETTVLPENITLNDQTCSLHRGQTLQLSVQIVPSIATHTDIFWSSEDERIAYVSENGLVRAIGKGTTIIRARTDNGLVAECEVTVDGFVMAEQIVLEEDILVLPLGSTFIPTAYIIPRGASECTMTWTSSDETIVGVDDSGCLTAVSVGHAIVTVSAPGIIQAECDITVVPSVQTVEIVVPQQIQIGRSVQLEPHIFPNDAYITAVEWSIEEGDVATLTEGGTLTFSAPGSVLVRAVAIDCGVVEARIWVGIMPESDYKLPESLTIIEEEAFYGSVIQGLIIPDSVKTIGPRAFANCLNLRGVELSSEIESIADDAFENCPNLTIFASRGSYAAMYAEDRGIPCVLG